MRPFVDSIFSIATSKENILSMVQYSIYVFSMLSLDHILISDLVVTDLLHWYCRK